MMNVETLPPKMESPGKTLPMVSPLLVLISAPSGGGKTTLCQQLLAARPQMTRAVTCTTRTPFSLKRRAIRQPRANSLSPFIGVSRGRSRG